MGTTNIKKTAGLEKDERFATGAKNVTFAGGTKKVNLQLLNEEGKAKEVGVLGQALEESRSKE